MARNNTLALDRENSKFLGVCAGLANYLEVEPWTVRLVFIASLFFGGWFLVPLYFACWFLLDDSSVNVRSAITDNLAVKHFRTVDYKKKIYRNKRDAKLLGICAGIADYLEVNVFAVRMIFVLLLVTTGGFPLIFYLAAWMVLDKRPDDLYDTPDFKSGDARTPGEAHDQPGQEAGMQPGSKRQGREEGQEEHYSKRREFQYCARRFVNLQSRLARMEAYVTSSRFKLHREFRNMT